ncbi:MAG: nitroreductase family protein, partial [Rhodococcus sp. (in: high G+C Gram-positive bacteria)]
MTVQDAHHRSESARIRFRDRFESDDQLDALLEAARWAPSANNFQPRRFVVARRGSHHFDTIVHALVGFNA